MTWKVDRSHPIYTSLENKDQICVGKFRLDYFKVFEVVFLVRI